MLANHVMQNVICVRAEVWSPIPSTSSSCCGSFSSQKVALTTTQALIDFKVAIVLRLRQKQKAQDCCGIVFSCWSWNMKITHRKFLAGRHSGWQLSLSTIFSEYYYSMCESLWHWHTTFPPPDLSLTSDTQWLLLHYCVYFIATRLVLLG